MIKKNIAPWNKKIKIKLNLILKQVHLVTLKLIIIGFKIIIIGFKLFFINWFRVTLMGFRAKNYIFYWIKNYNLSL